MDELCSSEIPATSYQTTQCYIPEADKFFNSKLLMTQRPVQLQGIEL